ncbi:hypothetical protein AU198_25480 [Mycobacterium sp. GA-1199]|nr:hypothetical protein AU198_25480 [Mycobacterium sp. GA-1199]
MRSVITAGVAAVASVIFAASAEAQPRPLICQLLDLGLQPMTVRAVLAYEDWEPGTQLRGTGEYTHVYYTTVGQSCPEYCDGVEC